MKKVLVLCARQEELDAFLALAPYTSDSSLYHQSISGKEVFLSLAGIGKVSRASSLSSYLAKDNYDLLINVGVAGSLSKDRNPLSTLVCDKCAYWDADLTAFGYPRGQMSGHPLYFEADSKLVTFLLSSEKDVSKGLILSGDSFITKDNKPSWLMEAFPGAKAIDRESASFAQVAYDHKIPFLVIRSISDDTQGNGNKEQYESRLYKACERAARISYKAIENRKD